MTVIVLNSSLEHAHGVMENTHRSTININLLFNIHVNVHVYTLRVREIIMI